MDTLIQDLRYGIRMLLKRPGFTAVAVFTLALGIGANTAIFSLVNAILLRPFPFPDPDRIVSIWETNPERGLKNYPVSPRNLEDWIKQSRTIERFGAWRDWGFTLRSPEGSEGIYAGIATPDLFKVFGVQPVLGRLFLPEEDQPGRNNVILLSHDFWQSRFGGDPNITGQSLTLSRMTDENYIIAGVLPRDFELPSFGEVKIWALVSTDPDQREERRLRNRKVYAQLKEGASLEEARVEMNTIARQLEAAYPDSNGGWGASVISMHENEVGDMKPILLVFWAAVGFVLLIACTNVASLMLARAAVFQREFAIRAALGAGRLRLIRLVLTESLLLNLLGGTLGLLLVLWLIDIFISISPASTPRLEGASVDARVLIFTLSLSLLTGLIFGLMPALQATRINLSESLKEVSRSLSRTGTLRLRSLLVISEIAISLVLLVGAGLMLQSFARLLNLDPGFNPKNILALQVFPSADKYKTGDQVAGLYRQITEQIEFLDFVESVGAVSSGPLLGGWEPFEFTIEGQPPPQPGQYPLARFYNTSPNYFRTMEIPVLRGRDFTYQDDSNSPTVAIINETMARRFWPGENPVGKRVQSVKSNSTYEIIGVVGDVKPFEVGDRVEPGIYWPYTQRPRWAAYVVARTKSDPMNALSLIRDKISGLDKDLRISGANTMDKLIATSRRTPQFNTILLGIFAVLALILTIVGIYGVVSYSVSQRTREIGIRMALGARRRDILKLIVGKGLALILTGIVLGLGASFALTRFISSFLYEVEPNDPATFAAVSFLLAIVTLAASYIPARRAAKVDPMVALRYE